MTIIRRASAAALVATILVALAPLAANKTIDVDAATIAEINAAFDAGTLTAESLVQMCLARIAAFDRKGPSLHAVITLNPKALETGPRARRRAQGERAAVAAARHPGRPQGQLRHVRHADHRRLGAARRIDSLEGRLRRQEAARCRRDHPRQGEHVRVRVGGRLQLARRPVAEPARPDAHAVGFVGRHRRRDRRGVRADRPRHRHRRIDSRTGDVERHRRPQADARPAEPRRHHPAGAQLRHRRPDGAQRLRRRRLRSAS